MALLSPGVNITEKNLGFTTASLPSSNTASVLRADMGEAFTVKLVTSEDNLVKYFGKPDNNNYKDWYNTRNFYDYASSMYVIRPIDTAKTTENTGVALSSGMKGLANSYTTVTNTPVVGETLTQATSLATGVVSFVNQVDGNASIFVWMSNITGTWDSTNSVTGSTSGAIGTPATVVASASLTIKVKEGISDSNLYNIDIAEVTIPSLVTDTHAKSIASFDGSGANYSYTGRTKIYGYQVTAKSTTGTDSQILQVNSVDTFNITGSFGARTLNVLDGTYLGGWNLDGTLELVSGGGAASALGETITGATSGATGVIDVINTDKVTLSSVTGVFTAGENLDGTTGGAAYTTVHATLDQQVTSGVTYGGTSGDENLIATVNEPKLTIYNRYVQNTQNLAIAVCSSLAAWNQPASTTASIDANFSSFYDVVPDFNNNEFALLVFEQQTDLTWSKIEDYVVSYSSSGKDIYNKSSFVEDVLLNADSRIFAKVGTNGKVVNTSAGAAPIIEHTWYNTIYPRQGADAAAKAAFPAAAGIDGSYDASGFTVGDIQTAFDLIDDPDGQDIGLILAHELDNDYASTIVATRKDAFAIQAPFDETQLVGKTSDEAVTYLTTNMGTFDIDTTSSDSDLYTTNNTYTGVYGNMKYQFDKYASINRWMPIHGDIAGLMAETDAEFFPWYAPAGTSRGVIKNAIKLAFTPNKTGRDNLYTNSINIVTGVPGEGTAVVMGQKTSTSQASPFSRVNVRRLLIEIEKTISRSVRPFIMEFADQSTWDSIAGVINPYLAQVQVNRGLEDFKVIVDSTNNPPAVVNANQIVIDIFVIPIQVAEFIQINVNVSKSGISFSELIG